MTNKILTVLVTLNLLVTAVIGYSMFNTGGGRGGTSNADAVSLDTTLTIGAATSGATAIQKMNPGTCNIHAGSNTIAATTTVSVDCQAGTGVQTALAGVAASDKILIQFATTTSTVFEGLRILGASASSTAGYITLKLLNDTGATFTWTSGASSSLQYLDFK